MLRRATAADLPALAAVYEDAVRGIAPARYPPEAVEAWAAFARDADGFRAFILDAHTLVFEDDTGVAGFGGLSGDGRIASLFVRASHARRGVARRIMTELVAIGRARGLTHFHTEASEFSRPVFERFGFRVIGTEVVEREGVPIERYRMET